MVSVSLQPRSSSESKRLSPVKRAPGASCALRRGPLEASSPPDCASGSLSSRDGVPLPGPLVKTLLILIQMTGPQHAGKCCSVQICVIARAGVGGAALTEYIFGVSHILCSDVCLPAFVCSEEGHGPKVDNYVKKNFE